MSNTEPKNTPDQSAKSASTTTAPSTLDKAPAVVSVVVPKPASVQTDVVVKKAVKTVAKKIAVAKSLPTKVMSKPAVKKVLAAPAPALAKPVKTPAVPAKIEKIIKQKKPKLVRDSFTIPKAEYMVLDELKQRSVKLANPAKKSELLRAGIKVLAALSDAAFAAAMKAVPTIKTGRPAKN
jgi:hypothetical protein